jgi:acetyl-CoA synthetase
MQHTPRVYESHLSKFEKTAHVKGIEDYTSLYRQSLDNPELFWSEQAGKHLHWFKNWDFVLHFDPDEAKIAWFGGGTLNAAYNCIDRHLDSRANNIAIYWEGVEPGTGRTLTFSQLDELVNTFAAVFKSRGVGRGDRVAIHMPMIPELAAAMLACARIGAVHCCVYLGFGPESLVSRVNATGAKLLVTADGTHLDGNPVSLSGKTSRCLEACPHLESVIVVKHLGLESSMKSPRTAWFHEVASDLPHSKLTLTEHMNAEDPLFIFYTSAAIGNPRGLVYAHGGYLLWAAMTARLILDLRDTDRYWCTEDFGWMPGHTLGLYGALLNGVATVMFEGIPWGSSCERFWEIIEKHRITKLSTSPTVVRTLAASEAVSASKHDLSSLQVLSNLLEPFSPDTWEWLFENVGNGRCPVMNMWWQAESGGPMMSSFPGVSPLKPGSVSFPFFGVEPIVLDLDTGEETRYPNQEGALLMGKPWPGMVRTIFANHDEYRDAYYAPIPGLFITSDGAKIDEDGYYWVTGRIDDVIKVSGRCVGAWELETALGSHPAVSEATAVGIPHPLKGQGIYLFVTLNTGYNRSDSLKEELTHLLLNNIGTTAFPDVLQWADALPKTRSGKILRRLLQKIAAGYVNDLGDTATVADPAVLEALVRDRMGFL